ncbi:MAG: NUDIX domain-containing protein [Patescibacteria group bacterium]
MKGFNIGIHVLIKKAGKYLILKRSATDPDGPGDWDLPGGGMKLGEQPFQAIRREAGEEAGVKVKNTRLLNVYAIPFRHVWSVEMTAEASYASGRIRLSPEHTEYRWMTWGQLKKTKRRSHPIKSLFPR